MIIDAVTRVLQKIPFTIEIAGPGVKVSARTPEDNKTTDFALHRAALVERCYDLINEVIPEGHKVRILMDGLDEHWDGSSSQTDSLSALFVAINRVRERLPGKLCVTVFIRDDMYEKLDLQHDVKYFGFKHRIRWDWEILFRMLERRLQHIMGVQGDQAGSSPLRDSLFEGGKISGRSVQAFLSEKLVPRPRDLIRFLDAAINQAKARGRDTIRRDDVERALSEYSDWRRNVILNEWQFEHLYVKELVESLRGKNAEYTTQQMSDHLDRFKKEQEIASGQKRLTKPKLLGDLLNWGVIGRRRNRQILYRWDVDRLEELAPQPVDVLFVHPSLWPTLSIEQPTRKAAASKESSEVPLPGGNRNLQSDSDDAKSSTRSGRVRGMPRATAHGRPN